MEGSFGLPTSPTVTVSIVMFAEAVTPAPRSATMLMLRMDLVFIGIVLIEA